jgi:hypothetical protein
LDVPKYLPDPTFHRTEQSARIHQSTRRTVVLQRALEPSSKLEVGRIAVTIADKSGVFDLGKISHIQVFPAPGVSDDSDEPSAIRLLSRPYFQRG